MRTPQLRIVRFAQLTITQVSAIGLALVSGFGGLLGFYIPEYAQGKLERLLPAVCSTLTQYHSWRNVRGYHSAHDIPYHVHGCRQPDLHASSIGGGP